MRYIKLFNESQQSDILPELKQFTEEALVELSDKGFSITVKRVIRAQPYPSILEIIIKPNGSLWDEVEGFMWGDIKDNMIPFLDILTDTYSVRTLNQKKLEDKELKGQILMYNNFYIEHLFNISEIIEMQPVDFLMKKIIIFLNEAS